MLVSLTRQFVARRQKKVRAPNLAGFTFVETPQVRSFDLFDTLVARRCIEPVRIFSALEARCSRPGFAEARIAAERSLLEESEYTLDDIYDRLRGSLGLELDAVETLKRTELELEFASLVPIRRHLAEVRPGDLIISDMYLPRPFLERVLKEVCGLRFNPLIVSSHGKSRGEVWPRLRDRYEILEHLGDNERSDFKLPKRHGVRTRLTAVASPTEAEKRLLDLGYRSLAEAARTARLGLPAADPALRALEEAQVGLNFPILFLACLILIRTARERGWKRLLFSSRDCFLMLRLFETLSRILGEPVVASYFYTSRVARVAGSPDYHAYFRNLIGEVESEAVVVDICGTGWSLARLIEQADVEACSIFLIHFIEQPGILEEYQRLSPTARPPEPHAITRQGSNPVLEALNTVDHGMVYDVVEACGAFAPRFLPSAGSDHWIARVRASHAAFDLALDAISAVPADEIEACIARAEPAHLQALYAALADEGDVVAEISAQQMAENQLVKKRIAERSA